MFITIYSQSGSATDDGIFIPISNLQGITAQELDSSEPDILREGKIIYGLTNQIYSQLTELAPLGFVQINKSNPSGTGPNLFTESVSFITQFVQDYSSRTFYPVPLPLTNVGKASIADVFPDATLVESGGNILGTGILFTHTTANTYGAITPLSVSVDARDWIFSIMQAAIAESTLRSTTVSSAITNRTNVLNDRLIGLAIPAIYYDATAPTSGILAENTPHLRLIQASLSIEYEVEVFPSTQSQEVRVAKN